MIAYLLDRTELALLWKLAGGKAIPELFETALDPASEETSLKSLSEKGYLIRNESFINIEHTVYFLLEQAVRANETEMYANQSGIVLRCPKLILLIERDPAAAGRFRLIPMKDEEMLTEYQKERGERDEPDNG